MSQPAAGGSTLNLSRRDVEIIVAFLRQVPNDCKDFRPSYEKLATDLGFQSAKVCSTAWNALRRRIVSSAGSPRISGLDFSTPTGTPKKVVGIAGTASAAVESGSEKIKRARKRSSSAAIESPTKKRSSVRKPKAAPDDPLCLLGSDESGQFWTPERHAAQLAHLRSFFEDDDDDKDEGVKIKMEENKEGDVGTLEENMYKAKAKLEENQD